MSGSRRRCPPAPDLGVASRRCRAVLLRDACACRPGWPAAVRAGQAGRRRCARAGGRRRCSGRAVRLAAVCWAGRQAAVLGRPVGGASRASRRPPGCPREPRPPRAPPAPGRAHVHLYGSEPVRPHVLRRQRACAPPSPRARVRLVGSEHVQVHVSRSPVPAARPGADEGDRPGQGAARCTCGTRRTGTCAITRAGARAGAPVPRLAGPPRTPHGPRPRSAAAPPADGLGPSGRCAQTNWSTATARNSSARYVIDQWNSRIGAAGAPERTRASSRCASRRNTAPATTAETR